LMRLPEGIILFWPFFFGWQRLQGRAEGLTGGEWLWVLSWLGGALLTGVGGWQALLPLPGALQAHAAKPRLLWYMVFVPAMALLAAVLGLLGPFLGRRPTPWTHPLSLALMIWPAGLVAVVLATGRLW